MNIVYGKDRILLKERERDIFKKINHIFFLNS